MANGGTVEYSHATYTCVSGEGCGIENGRVTTGTIRVADSSAAENPTPEPTATPTPEPTAAPTPTPTPTATPTRAQSASDRAVLVALYHSTGGANWEANANWLSDRPIGEWHGVTTDSNGRVITLWLPGYNLTGEIPPELGGLSNLTVLVLSSNQLTGEIPPELGGLSNLTHLYLYGNPLTGEIPPELGDLSNLEQLWLTANQLSGEIPPELGRLSNLTGLFLHGNQLTGCIPEGLRDIAENDLAELNLPDCGAATPGATATPTPTGTAASDRAAMIALYNSMGGPNWKNNANWLSDRPVGDWYGITTDNRGRIIRISLHYNGLNGQIPLQFGDLDALNYLELTGIDGDN